MGYPMAKNLRTGLGPEKTLLICDVNTEALSRFKTETEGQGPVEIVSNGFDAAQAAVGRSFSAQWWSFIEVDSVAADHCHHYASRL